MTGSAQARPPALTNVASTLLVFSDHSHPISSRRPRGFTGLCMRSRRDMPFKAVPQAVCCSVGPKGWSARWAKEGKLSHRRVLEISRLKISQSRRVSAVPPRPSRSLGARSDRQTPRPHPRFLESAGGRRSLRNAIITVGMQMSLSRSRFSVIRSRFAYRRKDALRSG